MEQDQSSVTLLEMAIATDESPQLSGRLATCVTILVIAVRKGVNADAALRRDTAAGGGFQLPTFLFSFAHNDSQENTENTSVPPYLRTKC
jgi:hypothetical protein